MDITEQNNKMEKLLNFIFENSPIGILVVDGSGKRFLQVNPAICHMLGYTEAELLNKGIKDIHPVDDLPHIMATFNAHKQRKITLSPVIPCLRKDGAVIYADINSVPITIGDKEAVVGFFIEATERKMAEEKIKETGETYRNLFQNAQVGLFRTRIEDGKILESNEQLAKICGYENREEFIAKYVTSINYVDTGTREKMIDLIKKDGFIKNFEARFYRKDGSIFWARYSAEIYPDKGWIEGVVEDITEFKKAEKRLILRNKLLEAIARAQSKTIAITEPAEIFNFILKEVLDISESKYGFIGKVLYTFDGKPYLKTYAISNISWNESTRAFYDKHAPDGLEFSNLDTLFGEVMKTSRPVISNDPVNDPRRGGLPDGHPPLNSFLGVPFISGDQMIGMLGIANRPLGYTNELIEFLQPLFITCASIVSAINTEEQRKIALSALKESHESFRELYENAPVGYQEIDQNGIIVRVNQTEADMLGYKAEEMVGQPLSRFIVDPQIKNIISGKLSGQIPPGVSYERHYLKKDRTLLPVLADDRLIKDREGNITGLRVTIQDISRIKEIEQEKKTLEAQLRQSQKMEAIGQLAGGIAHDFNNILTVITGYSALSLMKLKKGDPLTTYIEEIDKASNRAAELTSRLLAFSRKQILDLKVIDLNNILWKLEGMLRRLVREDIEILTVTSGHPAKIKADPVQIEQVIINLVTNAGDAMPQGGKLTIETANIELNEEYASKHIDVNPGRYVMLSVSDTGEGMTAEVKERIFEPFFTTKELGRGTGLGLSMVYGIVKQSGGSIWVYSEVGKGTTFKIYLPETVEKLEELKKEDVVREVPCGSETIMVVEDEDAVREIAVTTLQMQGYKVLSASGGGDALLACEKYKDPIHLILTDVVMPGMSGRSLVERLKGLHPKLKALYMSGYTDNAIVHHGILDASVHFIQKPFTFESLAKKVRQVLDE